MYATEEMLRPTVVLKSDDRSASLDKELKNQVLRGADILEDLEREEKKRQSAQL